MKAWRNPKNQAQFRKDNQKVPASVRVGKILRDTKMRIMHAETPLLGQLLIRGGYAPAP